MSTACLWGAGSEASKVEMCSIATDLCEVWQHPSQEIFATKVNSIQSTFAGLSGE